MEKSGSVTTVNYSYDNLPKLNDNLSGNTSILLALPPTAHTEAALKNELKITTKYDDVFNDIRGLIATYTVREGEGIPDVVIVVIRYQMKRSAEWEMV